MPAPIIDVYIYAIFAARCHAMMPLPSYALCRDTLRSFSMLYACRRCRLRRLRIAV